MTSKKMGCETSEFLTKSEQQMDACVYRIQVLISTFRTCLELRNRTLPLKDRSGDPLLPLFLYEESMVDGSVRKGLFCGPLLLKVSVAR